MENIVGAALSIAGSDMANLQLAYDDDLRIAAQQGFQADFLRFFDIVRGAECACGAAAKSGEPVVVRDVRTSAIFQGRRSLPVMLEAGALAVVSMPIVGRTRLLGMLSTHWRAPRTPDLAKLKRLEWLAQQAARILEGTASPLTVRGLEMLARH